MDRSQECSWQHHQAQAVESSERYLKRGCCRQTHRSSSPDTNSSRCSCAYSPNATYCPFRTFHHAHTSRCQECATEFTRSCHTGIHQSKHKFTIRSVLSSYTDVVSGARVLNFLCVLLFCYFVCSGAAARPTGLYLPWLWTTVSRCSATTSAQTDTLSSDITAH